MKKARIISLLAALAIGASLVGCKNDPSQDLADAAAINLPEGTGYTEIEITPPQGITGRPVDFWATEGGGLLYASCDGENIFVYESIDQGESWETGRTIAVEDAGGPSGVYSQGLVMLTPQGDVLDWAARAGEPENVLLERYAEDGNRTETIFSKAEIFDVPPDYIESAKALSENQILLSYSSPEKSGALEYGIIDLQTGELLAVPGEYIPDGGAAAFRLSIFAGITENTLYLAQGQNSAVKNELGTQDISGVSLGDAPGGDIKAFTAAGDALYALTDKNEVWKINAGESWEKLLHGQSGYALPEYTDILLRADTKGRLYMAAYGNGTTHIYRYGQEARQAKETLHILSLEYSKTAAAAAARFRTEHPETEVRYEALEETYEGQSRSDMLHALHAAIAAGNGPDVLILDGLPVSRYLAQGILTPLDDLIDGGDIYPSLLEPLRAEGRIYFVPAKFSMPLLFGPQQELEGMSSPQGLLEKIKAFSAYNPYIAASLNKTQPVSPDQCEPVAIQICMFNTGDWELVDGYGWGNGAAFDLWYRQYQASLLKDGQLDRTMLEAFFKQLKEAVDYYGLTPDSELWYIDNEYTVCGGCTGASLAAYAKGYSKIGFADLDDPGILAYALGDETTQTVFLPSIAQGVYEPKIMAGIPAGCKNTEQAAAFIQLLLRENSHYEEGEGCPSTRAGMSKRLEQLAGEKEGNDPSSNQENRRVYYQAARYQAATEKQMEELLSGLKTPVLEEPVLKETILEAARQYCRGEYTLEKAVDWTQQKIELWLAEQG